MIRVEVLGPGCIRCLRLEQEAARAIELAGVEAEVRKISDLRAILDYGVLSTPGLVIDGRVVSVGRIPRAEEIAGWLAAVARPAGAS
ncbi:MAG TPA: thioredoxin family protein [Candidatus Binatia bacterium]|nr:thioredoxin family protein [Candidatus Binatia bacterium]